MNASASAAPLRLDGRTAEPSTIAARPLLAALVRRHALLWLLAANLVGLLLAVELVWPAVGDLLAPLTYGRWMPLHLNWQLYGWGALPLVGALMAWCLAERRSGATRLLQVALVGWSLALILGGFSWLGRVTSGKLFLDWHGWARPLLPMAMMLLWAVLATHVYWSWSSLSGGQRAARVALLALLLSVAPAVYLAAGREFYPPVNPHSGGATGTSLLGSTLGVVAIFALLPVLLRVPRVSSPRALTWWWSAWAGSVVVYALLDHRHASHHAPAQIAGLGLLLLWVPLLIQGAQSYRWSPSCRLWLRAAAVWWFLLVLTGWLTFLPGLSERLKFTNALVAHAHLALAGLVTSVNFVVLNQLDPRRPLRRGFWWWQGGCAVMVAVLLASGWFERDAATDLFTSAPWTQAVYGTRLLAGGAMTFASILFWREARSS